jgi:hypothetical protein
MIKSFLIVLGVSLLSMCNNVNTKKKPVVAQPFETPPSPPIPPETYCYELHASDKSLGFTALELTIVGDSAFGKLNYKPNEKKQAGSYIVGVVYGNSLLMTCKYATDSGNVTEDQEWKMAGDSILKRIGTPAPGDSIHAAINYGDKSIFSSALYKVPCKQVQ